MIVIQHEVDEVVVGLNISILYRDSSLLLQNVMHIINCFNIHFDLHLQLSQVEAFYLYGDDLEQVYLRLEVHLYISYIHSEMQLGVISFHARLECVLLLGEAKVQVLNAIDDRETDTVNVDIVEP
jgi:hypothetical protein